MNFDFEYFKHRTFQAFDIVVKYKWVFLVNVILIIVFTIYNNYRPDKPKFLRTEIRETVDYSSDKDYLQCIYEQLECAYKNEENIRGECGEINKCDTNY